MVSSLGTVWARYRPLFIFWGITLLLIVASMLIQWSEADLPNRYTSITRSENCPLQVVVTYPSHLLLPVANTPEQILLIQVTNAQNLEYAILLSKTDWLIFYDQNGSVILPHWKGVGDAVFTAVVKAYPNQATSLQDHHIVLTEKGNAFSCSLSLGEISVETASHSRWRLGFGIFARNIALPLGLLSAIAGWVVSYLGKETDKLEIVFREKMANLATEFSSDPLYVVEQCLELKRIASQKSLGSDAEKELGHVVRGLFGPNGVGRLLKQIGKLANRQDQVGLMLTFGLVVSFYQKFAANLSKESEVYDIFRAIQQIRSYFSEQRNFALLDVFAQPMKTSIGEWKLPSFVQESIQRVREWRQKRCVNKAQNVIKQLLLIWDEQDVYSADLISYGLNKFQYIDVLQAFIKETIDKSPTRRRLKRYKPLAWLGDNPEPYEWLPLRVTEPSRYPALNHWFVSNQVINANPFEPFPRADTLLLNSRLKFYHRPEGWEILTNHHSGIFTSSSYEDLLSTTLLLQDYFHGVGQKNVFSILFECSDEWKESDWLTMLAHQAAETWLEFLAYSPDAYLDMYPDERRALASWFGWHCGSLKITRERLRQRLFHVLLHVSDEKKSSEKKKAGELLLDFLEEGESLYGKDYSPSAGQLLEWLSIRPFGIEKTAILLLSRERLPETITCSIENHWQSFRQRNLVLKQFFLTQDVQPEQAFEIRWSKEQLKTILAQRVNEVGGGRQNFSKLFEPPPFVAPADYDDQLAEKAHGSLHRMLTLGLKILFHHAQYHPDNPDLLPDDFAVIDES